MKTNVGATDRMIRFVLAFVALALYYSGKFTGFAGTALFIVGLLLLVTAWFRFCPLYSLLRTSTYKPEANFKRLMEENAVIVDVRQPGEFNTGHIKGSINIPLNELPARATTLTGKTVITCCASGVRSASAKRILSSKGIKTFNGGGWNSLQRQLV